MGKESVMRKVMTDMNELFVWKDSSLKNKIFELILLIIPVLGYYSSFLNSELRKPKKYQVYLP